ncbi:AHH domain-containing protein [Vibrio diabolicus]|uniref:AHH domain-containing protein n=1 Tax=Vibrio diabolicus TaxID=50719 RepID=UPI00215F2238|nr:AHH domain-containing protein [Vibrio diabolicus]MCS0313179.1 AHH domain-containing protein [Vibrio diabolicus]
MKHNLSIVGRKTNRPSNPTAAELALDRFDALVDDFYSKYRVAPPADETEQQRAKRLQFEAQDLRFLKKVRIELIAHARVEDMQAKLQSYSAENLKKNAKELFVEKHHPTTKLANNLTAAGEPKPTKNHEPHHIIPGSGRFRKAEMRAARLNLHMHKIGINAPVNGVWLTNYAKHTDFNWEAPKSPAHRSIHTFNYETWISSKFSKGIPSKQHFEANLLRVKMELKSGTYPKEVLEAKNEVWKG